MKRGRRSCEDSSQPSPSDQEHQDDSGSNRSSRIVCKPRKLLRGDIRLVHRLRDMASGVCVIFQPLALNNRTSYPRLSLRQPAPIVGLAPIVARGYTSYRRSHGSTLIGRIRRLVGAWCFLMEGSGDLQLAFSLYWPRWRSNLLARRLYTRLNSLALALLDRISAVLRRPRFLGCSPHCATVSSPALSALDERSLPAAL